MRQTFNGMRNLGLTAGQQTSLKNWALNLAFLRSKAAPRAAVDLSTTAASTQQVKYWIICSLTSMAQQSSPKTLIGWPKAKCFDLTNKSLLTRGPSSTQGLLTMDMFTTLTNVLMELQDARSLFFCMVVTSTTKIRNREFLRQSDSETTLQVTTLSSCSLKPIGAYTKTPSAVSILEDGEFQTGRTNMRLKKVFNKRPSKRWSIDWHLHSILRVVNNRMSWMKNFHGGSNLNLTIIQLGGSFQAVNFF